MAELIVPTAGATRYDFLRAMPEVHPDQRWPGWKVQAYDCKRRLLTETLPGDGFAPEGALDALKSLQWVVARWAPHHIRAWRGDDLPVTRVDVSLDAGGRWRIRKWLAGWMASTDPVSDELKPAGWDPRVVWDWLQAHLPADHGDLEGWRVERAGTFVRAWQGPKLPVRNGGQVKRMRESLHAYRVDLNRVARGESWVTPQRPPWMPETLSLDLDAIEALDFAYAL